MNSLGSCSVGNTQDVILFAVKHDVWIPIKSQLNSHTTVTFPLMDWQHLEWAG